MPQIVRCEVWQQHWLSILRLRSFCFLCAVVLTDSLYPLIHISGVVYTTLIVNRGGHANVTTSAFSSLYFVFVALFF